MDFDQNPHVNPYSTETPDQPLVSRFSMDFMVLEAQKESGDPPDIWENVKFYVESISGA